MSAQDLNLNKPVRYRKPRPDVFTLLLGIALVALIIACVFAYMEYKQYVGQAAPAASPMVEMADRQVQLAGLGAKTPSCTQYLSASTARHG